MADVYKQSFKQSDTNNIELSIFNCGLERCAPGQTWGPGIRDHYLIHLVVSGRGVFEVGGKTFAVAPGYLFFAKPAPISWPLSSPLPMKHLSTTRRTRRGCGQP